MPRKKKTDIRIAVAIIAGIAVVVAAYVGSPYFNAIYQDRPIIDVSLGGLESELPLKDLLRDEKNYYLQIVSRNRGNVDGKIDVTLIGTNAQIRYDGVWAYQHTIPYTIFPDPQSKLSSFYILPDEKANSFTVQLVVVDSTTKPQFQQLALFTPDDVTYEKTGEGYRLMN